MHEERVLKPMPGWQSAASTSSWHFGANQLSIVQASAVSCALALFNQAVEPCLRPLLCFMSWHSPALLALVKHCLPLISWTQLHGVKLHPPVATSWTGLIHLKATQHDDELSAIEANWRATNETAPVQL